MYRTPVLSRPQRDGPGLSARISGLYRFAGLGTHELFASLQNRFTVTKGTSSFETYDAELPARGHWAGQCLPCCRKSRMYVKSRRLHDQYLQIKVQLSRGTRSNCQEPLWICCRGKALQSLPSPALFFLLFLLRQTVSHMGPQVQRRVSLYRQHAPCAFDTAALNHPPRFLSPGTCTCQCRARASLQFSERPSSRSLREIFCDWSLALLPFARLSWEACRPR